VAFESLRSISDTVRVDIRKLDELMNLVGELVIQRNAIANVATQLAQTTDTARIGIELGKANKLLDRKLKELQAGVLDVRMVPLRQIFEKLSRVVRRLRRDHDKNLQLDFKGADTELDKLIVEQLVDPLMHVVRNSFDHGIEGVEERLAAGKAADGTIQIQAFARGNHVVIEVSDDGRGIDTERVRRVAEARGLVAPEDDLTHRETLDLVFSAGLSTRDEISETSGRGVGMDVVRSNLTALGAMVDIDSKIGKGTVVTMTLPITLAIIQALIVSVGEHRFALPLNSVLETLLLEGHEIQRSEGREILNLRGDALILCRLADEFGLDVERSEGKQSVVVLGMGEQRVGLLVDQLHGQQDTVIKPIKGPIRQIPGIAGATEVGDQAVVLVIDVSHIVTEALRRREAA
jgi:two-component system chemotaxis sensor kinase CheA